VNPSSAGERQLAGRTIERPRLTRLLDAASCQRLALVAPAGFGKTTLARQWVADRRRQGIWFRATPASTDVAALALDLGELLDQVCSGASERLRERLRTSTSPTSEAERLGNLLGDDLRDWPENAWLVIDDYQHLSAEPAAECFVDAFVSRSGIPLLVTSRSRPAWATAKHLLYGEVAEFGRSVLAMTHDEAALALPPSQQPAARAGLVALTEGWPALIGLASLVEPPFQLSGGEMPEALHAYFAEELYQGIDDDLQWNLVQLSLATTINPDLATHLFGERGSTVLEEAHDRGFLNRDGETFDLHPLLRQFLRLKLRSADPQAVLQTAESLAVWSLERSAWDECFALTKEFFLPDILNELMRLALDELLSKGRLATLEQWLEEARRQIPSEDVLLFTEIELAFRKGRWLEAESKARNLARRLPRRHPYASLTLLRAAQVAQLDDRQEEAFDLLNEASSRATTPAALRRVLWSRFISLTDLEEQDEAAQTLSKLEALPPESVEDMIRLSQAPIHFAVRWGGIREALDRHRGALDLLDKRTDPLVRTGFLQSFGTALALAAHYDEAYALAQQQLQDAESSGLRWIQSHGLELRGLAEIGMRAFGEAAATLHEARQLAEEGDDNHAKANALALLARIPLEEGDPQAALETLDLMHSPQVGSGMEGELRSIRALVLASMGQNVEARKEISASAALSMHLEARCLRNYAKAIVHLTESDPERATVALEEAVNASVTTGNADSFVTAYRAAPGILKLTGASRRLDEFLIRPLVRNDPSLAAKAGLVTRAHRANSSNGLTDREREVLALLRRGLSNRQIAQTLWITESTAKVHVRHIFDKLGVRTRTAAALLDESAED
jgi:LuxR family transcriptional regulator, maltose regulon positive regulatory protein